MLRNIDLVPEGGPDGRARPGLASIALRFGRKLGALRALVASGLRGVPTEEQFSLAVGLELLTKHASRVVGEGGRALCWEVAPPLLCLVVWRDGPRHQGSPAKPPRLTSCLPADAGRR
mgnify:CR=1 FL=1